MGGPGRSQAVPGEQHGPKPAVPGLHVPAFLRWCVRSVGEDGSHHFDLLDIQKVLGHSDPATTMRSYLDPLDTGVLSRAARVLD